MNQLSQGTFHVRRALDGRVEIHCPPVMIVPADYAVAMAQALLHEAGVQVIFAEPGQTVIRPPHNGITPAKRNGQ